jgi:NADPH:quinone reductase-like Zn-dependent oxidoreductase
MPTTMKAVVLKKFVGKYVDGKEALEECFEVKQVPRPVPGYNQVLVKVQRAQINPSDTSFCQNRYGKKAEPGVIPGFECCGVVVGHGGSPLAWWLMGKRVSTFGDGTWAEYIVVDALKCFTLNSTTSWANAAGAVANPLTVLLMLDIAKEEKMVVATAGSSSLVLQFVRAANSKGVKTIAVVRKDEQIEHSQANGAFVTLNSESPDFQEKLTALCKEHNVKIAFDSVAGDAGSKVLASLAPEGEMHVYGFLSGKPLTLPGGEFIFKQKVVRGLWLGQVFKHTGMLKLMRMKNELVSMLDTELKTSVQATFPLENIVDALMAYTSNLSGGKVQLIIGDMEQQ